MDGVEIGERVRQAREQLGWSARTLASEAGVSHAYVSHLEQGMYSRPGVDRLSKIAAALGLSLARLIGDEEVAEEQEGLAEIEVNLRTIGRLDPEALQRLGPIIAAVREQVERERGGGR